MISSRTRNDYIVLFFFLSDYAQISSGRNDRHWMDREISYNYMSTLLSRRVSKFVCSNTFKSDQTKIKTKNTIDNFDLQHRSFAYEIFFFAILSIGCGIFCGHLQGRFFCEEFRCFDWENIRFHTFFIGDQTESLWNDKRELCLITRRASAYHR